MNHFSWVYQLKIMALVTLHRVSMRELALTQGEVTAVNAHVDTMDRNVSLVCGINHLLPRK